MYSFLDKVLNYPSKENSDIEYIAKQLPDMSIKEGILSINNYKDPVFVYARNESKVIVVDTESNYNKYVKENIPMAITKNGVFMLKNNNTYQSAFVFKDVFVNDTIITSNSIVKQIQSVRSRLFSLIFFLFYPVSFLFKSVFTLINVAFFAFLGKVYSKITTNDFKFKQLFRLSVFAMFPPIIIDSLLNVYSYVTRSHFESIQVIINSSTKGNLVFLISVGYLYFALYSCSKQSTKKV